MTVTQIVRRAAKRAGRDFFAKYGIVDVLEQLNNIYQQYSDEYELIIENTTFTFTNFDNDSIYYSDVPARWLRPKRMKPFYEYRLPQVFRTTEPKTFTIAGRVIKFAGVSADSSFEVDYASKGKTLVETVADATTEVATPEWDPDNLHNILVYKLALWLNSNYPQARWDLMEIEKIEDQMESIRFNKQHSAPNEPGMQARNENYYVDDYDQE